MNGIKKIEERIASKELKIRKLRIKSGSSYLKRKKRAHKLITLGALFEISKLLEEDKELLLGYLNELHYLSNERKKILKEKGKKIFIQRKKGAKE